MVIAAVVVCEIGFWVVLGAGLLARYALRRPRLGAALLVCVPLVDLALLVFVVVDLRAGAPARFAHGLAAVYLGASVVFGHAAVRWADHRAAHRWARGPAPQRRPASGTRVRVVLEWREFAQVCAAAAISAGLLAGSITLVGDGGDVGELTAWFGRIGFVVVIWLVTGPVWESARGAATARGRGAAAGGGGRGAPPVRHTGAAGRVAARAAGRRAGLDR